MWSMIALQPIENQSIILWKIAEIWLVEQILRNVWNCNVCLENANSHSIIELLLQVAARDKNQEISEIKSILQKSGISRN